MNNFFKKIRDTGLALILIAGIGSCSGKEESNNIQEITSPIEIKIGESEIIPEKKIINGKINFGKCVTYAGMPSPDIFSLAYCGESGVNIYYPLSSETINYKNRKFHVLAVTPEKIILEYYSEKD